MAGGLGALGAQLGDLLSQEQERRARDTTLLSGRRLTWRTRSGAHRPPQLPPPTHRPQHSRMVGQGGQSGQVLAWGQPSPMTEGGVTQSASWGGTTSGGGVPSLPRVRVKFPKTSCLHRWLSEHRAYTTRGGRDAGPPPARGRCLARGRRGAMGAWKIICHLGHQEGTQLRLQEQGQEVKGPRRGRMSARVCSANSPGRAGMPGLGNPRRRPERTPWVQEGARPLQPQTVDRVTGRQSLATRACNIHPVEESGLCAGSPTFTLDVPCHPEAGEEKSLCQRPVGAQASAADPGAVPGLMFPPFVIPRLHEERAFDAKTQIKSLNTNATC